MKEIKRLFRLDAEVSMPGSKSYTQRALMIAALAEGKSVLRNCLVSNDTMLLIEALRVLGAQILVSGDEIVVGGTGGALASCSQPLCLGNNGTALRFLVSAVALGDGRYVVDGDSRLRSRPVEALLISLRKAGVHCRSMHGNGCAPVIVEGGGIRGGRIFFHNPISSQYISSILISAPYASQDITVEIKGKTVSGPYIDITIDVMKDFGVNVLSPGNNEYYVRSCQSYRGIPYRIEGDVSSASYFFMAAALLKGKIRVANIRPATTQGDIGILKILESLGCRIRKGADWVTVEGSELREGDCLFDMSGMPDLVPTVALLAAFKHRGCTRITGVPHLRYKESDRISAMVRELNKVGAKAEERKDGMLIRGGKIRGAEIETYNDHRIAMSFAVAGLAVDGMKIKNADTVAKSFPSFWDVMEGLS
ncbi:MAG: 3-phosphoshikimate 1-carboxyvinyltransferase [Syntrophales bacterium]|jgi:3-phosphoshikimate 1-carboxyvinyltransferase|nr:3-phosphoshikimate 1-carboxyvinyltransferase [Syntrophales bacterium]MDY0043225.1 3-phosphoshikimate 1-carboxyvinyltransferase [Syntrophales bacterium]